MKQEVLDQLNASFDVKTKPGKGNYKYIDSKDVIDRMNTVFKGRWSTIVESSKIIEDHVLIEVLVRAYDDDLEQWVDHTGFGSSQIARFTYGDNAGKPIDIGNIYKGALSKAIRSACTRLGAGLYLDEDMKVEDTTIPTTYRSPSGGAPSGALPAKLANEVPPALPNVPPVATPTAGPVIVPQPKPVVEEVAVPTSPAVSLPPDMPSIPAPEPAKEVAVPVQEAVSVNEMPSLPTTAPAGTPTSPVERIKQKKAQEASSPVPPASPAPVVAEAEARMVSDVQLAALEGVLSVKGTQYEALAKEAFEDSNLTDDVPDKNGLTYNQAVVVIKYGNEKNRRAE